MFFLILLIGFFSSCEKVFASYAASSSSSFGISTGTLHKKEELQQHFQSVLYFMLQGDSSTKIEYRWLGKNDDVSQDKICCLRVYEKVLHFNFLQEWAASHFKDIYQKLQEQSERYYWLRLCLNGDVIGGVGFSKTTDAAFMLEWIFVDPKYQKKGLGRHLVFAIGLLYPEANDIFAAHNKMNEVACKFFEHTCGFKRASQLSPGYGIYTGYRWQGDIHTKILSLTKLVAH